MKYVIGPDSAAQHVVIVKSRARKNENLVKTCQFQVAARLSGTYSEKGLQLSISRTEFYKLPVRGPPRKLFDACHMNLNLHHIPGTVSSLAQVDITTFTSCDCWACLSQSVSNGIAVVGLGVVRPLSHTFFGSAGTEEIIIFIAPGPTTAQLWLPA